MDRFIILCGLVRMRLENEKWGNRARLGGILAWEMSFARHVA